MLKSDICRIQGYFTKNFSLQIVLKPYLKLKLCIGFLIYLPLLKIYFCCHLALVRYFWPCFFLVSISVKEICFSFWYKERQFCLKFFFREFQALQNKIKACPEKNLCKYTVEHPTSSKLFPSIITKRFRARKIGIFFITALPTYLQIAFIL